MGPGLRLVVFLCLAVAALTGVGPVMGTGMAMLGVSAGGIGVNALFGGLVSAALLAVTWISLRSEGAGLGALGLLSTRRRIAEFGAGLLAAATVFAGVALARALFVGAEWSLDPAEGLRAAVIGLPIALLMLLPEELLFRGYGLRKAVDLWGAPAALVLSSAAFGAYHVIGSGYWGIGAVFLFAMPALGGLVFGYAALRSRGLALPTGLHLGGNWVNASVLGLGVPEGTALWRASLTEDQVAFLTAPDLIPRLPYIVGVLALGLLVSYRFTRRRSPAAI
jgi:membrane protease YdiL (CAAX protease family)